LTDAPNILLKANPFYTLATHIRRCKKEFVTELFIYFKILPLKLNYLYQKMTLSIPENKKIILFDGVCNLCNNIVLTIIKHDKKDVFRFVSLQSDTGKKITTYLKIDTEKVDSIILYEPKIAYYIKSTAALKITTEFNGFWKFLQIFWIIPESIRDMVYTFIAKNRYKWFGKKDSCMIPTKELTAKFLK